VEPQVFEEFMHVQVLLKDEDAPTVSTRMPLHQKLEGLKVNVSDVVHPSVDFTDVDAEDGQLVPVQRVLQESEVHFHFELSLKHYSNVDEVLATLAGVVVGNLLDWSDDLIH
jgi:hypothetical protein